MLWVWSSDSHNQCCQQQHWLPKIKGQVTDSVQKMLVVTSLPSAKSKSCWDGIIYYLCWTSSMAQCSGSASQPIKALGFKTLPLPHSVQPHTHTLRYHLHSGHFLPHSVQSYTHTLRYHLHSGHFFKPHVQPHILCYRTPETPHLLA